MRILLAVAALVASPPSMAKVVLDPAQVGPGYVPFLASDGVGVKKTVTLNLCGVAGYPSERLRIARLQVSYLKRGSPLGLSNEVVSYRPGGAAQAMSEVIRHVRACPSGPIATGDPALPPLRVTLTRLDAPKLLAGYVAVRERVRGVVKGKYRDETSYAVYQRLGNVLSGTYSSGPNTKAQLSFVLRAARRSALRLRLAQAAAGPTA